MAGIKDSDNIEELRERLYKRGEKTAASKPHKLADKPREIPDAWQKPETTKQHDMKRAEQTSPVATAAPSTQPPVTTVDTPAEEPIIADMPKAKKTNYRVKLILGGLGLFTLMLMISIGLMLFGNNNYSGKNITIDINSPFTVGGGETLPIQVAITNGNDVNIESATLLVEYAPGTVSADEERKPLFIERIPLDSIGAGETINMPLRVIVFGEENEEQLVKVSIEYRTENSNARLFKEVDPLRYKISSSPVSIKTESLQKTASGQATDVKITIESNAPTKLSEVLVRAEYPIGFDYQSAEPSPSSGENAWLITDLEPGEQTEIVIKGVVIGKETDEYAINFTVGVPDKNNRDQVTSIFATAQTQFAIEQPFLNVELSMGNIVNDTRILEPGQPANASIEITNTLNDTIYDIVVSVQLSGNALSDLRVGPPNGFYDSRANKITWDVSNTDALKELKPNQSTRVSFVLEPDTSVTRTPEVAMDVTVEAQRVREAGVVETLVGTAAGAVKVSSEPDLMTTLTHRSGPLPPQAEVETNYVANMVVRNGSNDLVGARVTTVLPTYVTWQGAVAGNVSYNQSTRTVTWNLGNISAGDGAQASFEVEVVPSVTQIGRAPIVVGEQSLRAEDRFTGTTVTDTYAAQTTEVLDEWGQSTNSGRVTE